MHLEIIICTKDRPIDLERLLNSISIQTRQPDNIIVVDGSDDPVKFVVDRFTNLSIDYFTERPPSLPKQRNTGISHLRPATEWVGFLDDDLVLDKSSLQELEFFIDNHKEKLGGLGLVIDNIPDFSESFIRRLFLLDKKGGGQFTLSGCPSRLRVIENDQKVEWLSGGATFWNKNVLQGFSFDEWFSGTGYYEDVDFSFRVAKEYGLYRCAKARCQHLHHQTRKSRMFGLGEWQLVGWWYFARKHREFNVLLVLLSMMAVCMFNLFAGLIKPSSFRFLQGLGNIKGFGVIFSGNALKLKTFHK